MDEVCGANRDSLFGSLARGRLNWLAEIGVGYYPVEAGIKPYDAAYFERFAQQATTPMGRALMSARCDFVARHLDRSRALVDVGIGSGAFIEARKRRTAMTYGYDVCPVGIAWLNERNLFVDPWVVSFEAISLWDVLEHMLDFRSLLANAREWVFTSLPIFRDAAHALSSKHFRPDEHCWYFTRDGLVRVMEMLGFELIEESAVESELGREDIGSFAFRRSGASRATGA